MKKQENIIKTKHENYVTPLPWVKAKTKQEAYNAGLQSERERHKFHQDILQEEINKHKERLDRISKAVKVSGQAVIQLGGIIEHLPNIT